MPQTQGGGTVYAGGPGSSMRGPLYIKSAPGSSGNFSFVQIVDAAGNWVGPPIPSAEIDPQVIQYKKVSLTAAQVKALHGTPITLLAAPGAGKCVVIYDAQLFVTFGTTQYAAGSTIQILQNSIAVFTSTAALLNAVAANAMLQMACPGFGTTQTNGADNAATTITASGSEFTTGDSVVDVHLWYSVVTG